MLFKERNSEIGAIDLRSQFFFTVTFASKMYSGQKFLNFFLDFSLLYKDSVNYCCEALNLRSTVIRQKGESQKGCFKKTRHI